MEAALKGMSGQDLQRLQALGETLRNEVVAMIESLIKTEEESTESLEARKIDSHGELQDFKTSIKSIKQYGVYQSNKGTGFSRDA